ncbi:GGDEF domain-containing protein [Enterovirga rhinocerotis]|uniref:diguanylate cyclase n=1 Tax=Enterovirga rhinocerotis TaxID=1339210 RepID=A0A4R7BYQ6_9HYPH|nr:GGDEF domain-containing protein [Enterovirga rhinocerotis]TDR90402.1 diguanylate cyclase (GGDEF)-like protein [Enterovirga rhinocerotis]
MAAAGDGKAMIGLLVLFVQASLYFWAMALVFRARRRLGVGVFVCCLGVMHFLETYLAAVFFIQLPFGLISPGSTVLFSGKLAMILLLYAKEDAETVRQPIYGLLLGNCLLVLLAAILRFHSPVVLPDYNADLAFIDQLGLLMIWGTLLLFADSILLILLFERLRSLIRLPVFLYFFLALAIILSVDQILFYHGLKIIAGAPTSALEGGWIAKIGAALIYSLFIAAYLRWIEPAIAPVKNAQSSGDLFDKLTYRHRYEALLKTTGIDPLTGVMDRRRLEEIGAASAARAIVRKQPLSVAIIDVDHFKDINDRYGHLVGDEVLVKIAAAIKSGIRAEDHVFRYGGEEFVVLGEAMPREAALLQAERLRSAIPAAFGDSLALAPTVSIGVATGPLDGASFLELLARADSCLYTAKREGRNRVVGSDPTQHPTSSAQPAHGLAH